MFDNGRDRVDAVEYSRALELELDGASGTATRVWEFRPFPDEYSRSISSARRLPGGNTLIAFGNPSATPIRVYEVTRDGEVVWLLEVFGAASMYRANPLADIAGEVVVTAEPTPHE